jgi:hypothetical protein
MTRKHDIAVIAIAFVALVLVSGWPLYTNLVGLEIDLKDCQPKWLPSKIDRAINPKSFWRRQAKHLYRTLKDESMGTLLRSCEQQSPADSFVCMFEHKTNRDNMDRCLRFSMIQFRREGDFYLFESGDQDE